MGKLVAIFVALVLITVIGTFVIDLVTKTETALMIFGCISLAAIFVVGLVLMIRVARSDDDDTEE